MQSNQTEKRPLAYSVAQELIQIAGGTYKLSVQSTQRSIGNLPGPAEFEVDPVWD